MDEHYNNLIKYLESKADDQGYCQFYMLNDMKYDDNHATFIKGNFHSALLALHQNNIIDLHDWVEGYTNENFEDIIYEKLREYDYVIYKSRILEYKKN